MVGKTFCFTEEGADGSATAYSVVETALANGLNVFEYLRYVFDILPLINDDELRGLITLFGFITSKFESEKIKTELMLSF